MAPAASNESNSSMWVKAAQVHTPAHPAGHTVSSPNTHNKIKYYVLGATAENSKRNQIKNSKFVSNRTQLADLQRLFSIRLLSSDSIDTLEMTLAVVMAQLNICYTLID